jgi:tyrosinase
LYSPPTDQGDYISSRVRNGFYPLDVVDKLRDATMPKVEAWMAKKAAAGKNNNCTLENAAVRREWSVFQL